MEIILEGKKDKSKRLNVSKGRIRNCIDTFVELKIYDADKEEFKESIIVYKEDLLNALNII